MTTPRVTFYIDIGVWDGRHVFDYLFEHKRAHVIGIAKPKLLARRAPVHTRAGTPACFERGHYCQDSTASAIQVVWARTV